MDIRSLIDEQAAVRGDHPCLIWEPFEGQPERWTYAEFHEAVRRVAGGLHARGVQPGQRVLIHLDNCPESIVAWLGCAYAGAVGVTTNAKSTADELRYFAEHSGAVGAITQPKFADLVALAAPALGWRVMTETDNGAPAAPVTAVFEPFAALAGEQAPDRPQDPWAHFGIQYTSGTTARPKAVLWTHANALWGARQCATNEDLRPTDVHLVHLPLFHTNAQAYSVLAALWAGATIVLAPRFSASRFWPVSLKHGATWTSVVPFCVKALAEQPRPEAHSYRFWGNAICEPPWDQMFGVKTIGWWGMTETIAHGIVGSPHRKDAPLSMGRPAPGYEIFVLDADGRPVAPGEIGDLYVRGMPGVSLFLEYVGDPDATRAAFRDDGLFITGDRVRLGHDGCLYFSDRSKDMLKVGGENVAASEIERVIGAVPGVAEVAVVGMRHSMLDEAPAAFVIPHADADPGLEDRVAAACVEALAAFKRPHLIRLVDSLPRSTLNKIAKADLRAQLAAEAAA
ncbi:MAG: AMP-binding protein [Alphaproteobacteria bacterium]|nr:AMP-binding protein [Alphaproteobacteria bacterium]MBU1516613.1 AMP-binding protein [Alphaproteobacteria bacterium]MBU2094369.1 AMP-binding protein [Alphaproteobacteria bacterium]MBU2153254.1 AMP-binding protein [Alphaproteobacteria bacterium]MBU2307540.1 AMP-binding protein [Alphaproteobacteria bacterium]